VHENKLRGEREVNRRQLTASRSRHDFKAHRNLHVQYNLNHNIGWNQNRIPQKSEHDRSMALNERYDG
jgi:hypothetical protein